MDTKSPEFLAACGIETEVKRKKRVIDFDKPTIDDVKAVYEDEEYCVDEKDCEIYDLEAIMYQYADTIDPSTVSYWGDAAECGARLAHHAAGIKIEDASFFDALLNTVAMISQKAVEERVSRAFGTREIVNRLYDYEENHSLPPITPELLAELQEANSDVSV